MANDYTSQAFVTARDDFTAQYENNDYVITVTVHIIDISPRRCDADLWLVFPASLFPASRIM
jgi:hypothetical protein